MESMVLAIVMIVAGAAAWVIGPSVGGAQNRGKAKLLGFGLMLAGIAVAGMNTVVVINVGEVGVKHFLGSVDDTPMGQAYTSSTRSRRSRSCRSGSRAFRQAAASSRSRHRPVSR